MDGDERRDELERRRALARRMGGPEAVERQHRAGKLSARERIDLLLDAGSFRELGTLTGRATHGAGGALGDLVPANALIGTGTIDGRKVAVSADDFTIRGGSSESTVAEKWIYAERLALELRMPLLRLVDSAGGSVRLLEQQQHTRIPGYPSWPLMPLLGAVPVVGVALGSCAGLGAIKVAGSHFSIMARGTSQVFAAGPPVVKQAFNVDVDKEGLGGYRVHTRKSGVVDNEAADEPDALRQARRFLGYLPRHVWELAPVAPCADPAGRAEEWLKDAIPPDRRKLYDPRRILEGVLDRESIFEIGRYHGGSTITCLARLGGIPAGVIGNDPKVAGGAMTRAAAQKTERFVDLCDTFHLPIVNFVDQPGLMTAVAAEEEGTITAALRAIGAIEQSVTPWVTIIVRRAFGVAGGMHGRKHGVEGRALDHRFAWPTARWGSIPVEGGVAAAHRREIEAAPDPTARRLELEERYHQLASPFRTAERFGVTDIIDPRETRPLLCDWVLDAWEVATTQVGPRARTLR